MLKSGIPDLEQLGTYKHSGIKDLPSILAKSGGVFPAGLSWQDYFSFAFVRNPWERLVSWYTMIVNARRIRNLWVGGRARRHWHASRQNEVWKYVYATSRSFTEFIERCTATIPNPGGGSASFLRNQYEYVSDEAGDIRVTEICRVENFGRDVQRIMRRFGISSPVHHTNKSRHAHYSRYYTDKTRRIVARRFRTDIEKFGYRFVER